MKNIKLVASDVDGTLINNEYKVTPYTKEIVSKLKDKGIEFVIATGRAHDSALEVANDLDINKDGYGLICLNGLRTYSLPLDTYEAFPTMTYEECETMEVLGQKYHMGILYCFDDVIYFQMDEIAYLDYTIGMKADSVRYFNDKSDSEEIKNLKDIKHRFDKGDPIQKIVYVQSDDFMNLITPRIKKDLDPNYDALLVGQGWLELMPKSITKGSALLKYAESLGIKPEEIMAFGDAENDISMLKVVGHGVAMGNAMDSVKEIAKDITDTNYEDGVAKYIAKHLL